MNVILNGAAGRMGQVLQKLIADGCEGASLAAAVGAHEAPGILPGLDAFHGEADCIIDFSTHTITQALTDYAVARKLPLVIATTGQTEEEQTMIRRAAEQIPVFYAGNFSLGIALLREMVAMAVKLFPEADIEIVEQHHNQKVDVPSGTALMLAKAVQEARPDSVLLVGRHENGKRTRQEIGIHSLRMGSTVGIHEVIVNTGSQILTLKHEAQDRSLFGEGALRAARFLLDKGPGLYQIDSLLREAL